MAWGRNKPTPQPPKCRVCVPGRRCDVYDATGHSVVWYCRVCRRGVPAVDMLKKRIELVRRTSE